MRNEMAHNIQTEMLDEEFCSRIAFMMSIALELFVEAPHSQEKWSRHLEKLRGKGDEEEEEEDLQLLAARFERWKEDTRKVIYC